MDRAQKQVEIESISKKIAASALTLCANARGLTVGEVTTLRRNLKGAGATAKVVKNKLAARSVNATLSGADKDQFLNVFKGPSFVVFADTDPVAPTKVLADFAKQNSKFEIKGAWVDGKFLDNAMVEQLSKMPGKKELLAKLLALINAPATQLVGLLQAPSAQVVRVIDAQRQKLEGK